MKKWFNALLHRCNCRSEIELQSRNTLLFSVARAIRFFYDSLLQDHTRRVPFRLRNGFFLLCRRFVASILITTIACTTLLINPPRAYAADTIIFITSNTGTCGANCWDVPSDWTTTNTIEVIGGGGGGRTGGASGSGGGAGGAYSIVTNLSTSTIVAGGTLTYQVGSGGGAGTNGGDTYFNRPNGSATTCTATTMSVCAKGGLAATNATGAATTSKASNVPASAGANGGKGGNGSSNGDTGGGGGGAGGPHGDGQTGGNGDTSGPSNCATTCTTGGGGGGGGGADGGRSGSNGSSTKGGDGAANRSGQAGGTGGTNANGSNGTNGGSGGGGGDSNNTSGGTSRIGGTGAGGEVLWTQTSDSATAGPGGGGGGTGNNGSSGANGGSGGSYGGGGGGGESSGGSGIGGIIIITYTPSAATKPTVTTDAAQSFTPTSATLLGSVTASNGDAADTCGFAYGTVSTLATVIATTSSATCPADTGSFQEAVGSLSSGQTYYYRAYAINTGGTGLGSILSFVTGNTTPSRKMRLFEGYRIKIYGSRILLTQQ